MSAVIVPPNTLSWRSSNRMCFVEDRHGPAYLRPHRKAYVARHTTQGKSRREIMRCLKGYIAREVFQLLTNPHPFPLGQDLRRICTAAGINHTDVATGLGSWPIRISELERGFCFDAHLAADYRAWLLAGRLLDIHRSFKRASLALCRRRQICP